MKRSREGIIGGVCGGLANHMQVDPLLVRLLFLFLFLVFGFGPLLYIILWLLVPLEPEK